MTSNPGQLGHPPPLSGPQRLVIPAVVVTSAVAWGGTVGWNILEIVRTRLALIDNSWWLSGCSALILLTVELFVVVLLSASRRGARPRGIAGCLRRGCAVRRRRRLGGERTAA
jgi:hypothetical protein